MRTIMFACGLLLAVTVVVSGCGGSSEAPQPNQYPVHGKVVAVDQAQGSVTLDHEDIPGLMKAMEMQFKVENPQVLEGVSVGDQVHGQLEVRSGDYIITDLNKR